MPPYATYTPSAPEYLHFLPVQYTPNTPYTHDTPWCPLTAPNTPRSPRRSPMLPYATYTPLAPEYLQSLPGPQYILDTPTPPDDSQCP